MPMLLDPKNRSCAFHTDGKKHGPFSSLSLVRAKIISPRQARDKHQEISFLNGRFWQFIYKNDHFAKTGSGQT
jgi:hypothetical protein